MLYIFRVDTGCMINLEMSLALETVTHLRNAVVAQLGHSGEQAAGGGRMWPSWGRSTPA